MGVRSAPPLPGFRSSDRLPRLRPATAGCPATQCERVSRSCTIKQIESLRIGRQWIVVREPSRMFLHGTGHPGAHCLAAWLKAKRVFPSGGDLHEDSERRITLQGGGLQQGLADVAAGRTGLPEAEHCAHGGPGRARPCSCAWLRPVPQGGRAEHPSEMGRAGPARGRRLVRLASPCSLVAASWQVMRIREITAWWWNGSVACAGA